MMISTKGRYALRLMIDLAQHNDGGYVALKDICQRQQISMKYLEQIVSHLGKAGFLKSARGAQGGYQLSKSPRDYTIGSILRLMEGELAPVPCVTGKPNQCPRYSKCPAAGFWKGLDQAVNKYIDSVTLADLVRGKKKTDASMPVYFL